MLDRFAKGMHNDWLSWRFAKGMHNDWLSWRFAWRFAKHANTRVGWFAEGHSKDPTTQRCVVGQIPARIFPREDIFANPIKRRAGGLAWWPLAGFWGWRVLYFFGCLS
jgi:hypothetical protein